MHWIYKFGANISLIIYAYGISPWSTLQKQREFTGTLSYSVKTKWILFLLFSGFDLDWDIIRHIFGGCHWCEKTSRQCELPGMETRQIDRQIGCHQKTNFSHFFQLQHFSFHLKALIMSSFKWHSVTSWHFCYSPPHDPPLYCSAWANRPICMRPELRIAPLPTLWRLGGYNKNFNFSYKSTFHSL